MQVCLNSDSLMCSDRDAALLATTVSMVEPVRSPEYRSIDNDMERGCLLFSMEMLIFLRP